MKKLTLAAGLLLSLGLTTSAFASDGTVTITGKINEQTCTVDTNNGKNLTVKLPTVQKTALATANSVAGKTPFSITLTNCKVSATDQVALFFLSKDKQVNPTTGNLLNIAEDSNTKAGNVEIQLLNDNDEAIQVGKNLTEQGIKPSDLKGTGETLTKTLNYKAQYISTGTATAGDVKAQVEYNIIYQ